VLGLCCSGIFCLWWQSRIFCSHYC